MCRTYGVEISLQSATGSALNKMSIDIPETDIGPQYKVSHCANGTYIRCGGCGRLTCFNYGEKELYMRLLWKYMNYFIWQK